MDLRSLSIAAICAGALLATSRLRDPAPAPQRERAPADEKKPVELVYLAGWSENRDRVLREIGDRATHLAFAFVEAKQDGQCGVIGDDRESRNDQIRALQKFQEYRRLHPGVRTILSIGGYNNSRYLSVVSATAKARAKFVASCSRLADLYEFDGFDLDWEVPGYDNGYNIGSDDDADNEVLLAQAFRKAIRESGSGRELIVSVGASPESMRRWYRVGKLAAYVDYFSMMAHSFCRDIGCDPAPLTPGPGTLTSGQEELEYLRNEGVPAAKILYGVPFYGFARYRSGDMEEISYRDVLKRFLKSGKVRDVPRSGPWKVTGTAETYFVYEPKQRIREKMRFARKHGLGGYSVWEAGQDTDAFELLDTVRDSFSQR